jgi:RNA polymerase sigma-54 factor
MRTVVEKYFDDFLKNHWSRLQTVLNLDEEKKNALLSELKKLNPKPGSSLGETQGFSIDRINPDFIIETFDDGQVSFSLNDAHLPQLTIAQSYTDTLDEYKKDPEAYAFAKKGIDGARGLIDALKTRRQTMTLTMRAIIRWQYKFFQDGDENDLRPMRLKDIAEKTGLDISTISRVTNEKYAQTRWGIFRLRFFFTDKYTNENGEELSTRRMKLALKEIVDQEDKKHPLSDSALEQKMKERGFDIARRTIMKYRDQMGIPKATLRKE